MSRAADDAAIPTEIAEFIAFFQDNLAELSFPDLDLASLGQRADAVIQSASQLADLEESVRAARAALEGALAELDRHARRGLAYAKVYAQDDESLTQAIDELALCNDQEPDKSAGKRKPKARAKAKVEGQTRRAGKNAAAELPFSGAAAPGASEAA